MRRHPHRERARGFSLIELMISLTLGLILLSAVISILLNISSANKDLHRTSRQLDNARYALKTLSDDIVHAGFYGQYDQAATALPIADADPCLTTVAALTADLPLAVQGLDAQDSDFALPSCIPSTQYRSGTDLLVVRRGGTSDESGSLDADKVYLQGRYDSIVVNSGADATVFNLQNTVPTPAENLPIRRYELHLYFVSPCSQTGSTCNDGIPSLKRLELDGDGTSPTLTIQTVALGIENLQLYYAVDSAPAGSLDGSPDAIGGQLYVSNPGDWTTAAGQTAWSNVVSIEAFLLARNLETTTGYRDTKSYVMSPVDATTAFTVSGNNDAYKRRLLSQEMRLYNIVMRRS